MSSIEGTVEDDSGSDRWLDLDDTLAVPVQSLDEILAQKETAFDDDISEFEEDDSFTRLGTLNVHTTPITYQLDCPILQNRLNSSSHQIRSVEDKPFGGKPTAICVSANIIAIGTSRGLTALFDRKSDRLIRFMRTEKQISPAPVSAICFSADCSKIAVGYGGGSLRVYATNSTKPFISQVTAVQPGHAVVQVLYTWRSILLLIDSGGSVYEYHKRQNRCLLAGSKGEIVTAHLVESEQLILFCTLHHVLIFTYANGFSSTYLRLVGPPNTPPVASSFHRIIPITAKASASETRLCLARGNEIRIFQIQLNAQDNVVCPLIKVFRLDDALIICNICWMDEEHLLILDQKEKAILVNIRRGVLLASVDISHIQLVSGSADFKGLSAGGIVSEARKPMAQNVCYQSVCPQGSTLYLLGQNGVFTIDMLSQKTQMERFEERREIASAVLYATDVYSGRVVDRTANKSLWQYISSRLSDLLLKLLEITVGGLESGRVVDLVEHYKKHIYVLLRGCITTSHFDLLYNTVYRRLESDPLAKQIFFESLEEFIVDSNLESPPPSLVQEYLGYLITEGQLPLFETAVTRMPINCLDIHQVVTTCRQNHLFDGIIYVMNNALHDYMAPLEEMFEYLATFASKSVLSDWEVTQGNKLLLYLSCCLAGKGYPFGQLPNGLEASVPMETYRFLISLQSQQFPEATDKYPHLRLILTFDTNQFLNVICTCVDAPLFSDTGGRLKRFVDILVGISEEWDELAPRLITFLTHLLQRNSIPKDNFLVESLVLRIIEQLTVGNAEPPTQHRIVELLRLMTDLSLDNILEKSRKKPLVHICAFIYQSRRQYVNLLMCSMEDATSVTVFDQISILLNTIEDDELSTVRLFIQNSMERLNQINSMRTAELFLEHFIDYVVISRRLPFDLLRNLFAIRRANGLRSVCDDHELDGALFRSFFEATLERGYVEDEKPTEMRSLDEFDRLLADSLSYWLPIGAHDDGCLNAAVRANLLECSVLLLVARGHISRAFLLLFDSLEKCKDNIELLSHRIMFMLRLSEKCEDEAKEGDWLMKLFHFLLLAKDKEIRIDDFDSTLSDILITIVERCDDVSDVIETLFDHKSLQNGSFCPLVGKTLLSCEMNEIMQHNVNECIRAENLNTVHKLTIATRSRHSKRIESDFCIYCGESLTRSFLIYRCSHLCHDDCADRHNRQCPCSSLFPSPKQIIPTVNRQNQCPSSVLVPAHEMFHQHRLQLNAGPIPL